MNFSVNKLNDASVLALLECDTLIYKGLILYPVPFMGDDDAPVVELIKKKFEPRQPKDSDDDLDFKPVDYHVIFNLTPYSNAVASIFTRKSRKTLNGLLTLSCDLTVNAYMENALEENLYIFIETPNVVRDIFETIDPMKIAKFGTFTHKPH